MKDRFQICNRTVNVWTFHCDKKQTIHNSFASGAADVAFAGAVGGHAAIGQDEAGHAVRREVVDEVLHPSEVGVAFGLDAELMNATAFILRVGFSSRSRSARLAAVLGLKADGGGRVAGLGLAGCFSCHAGVSLM